MGGVYEKWVLVIVAVFFSSAMAASAACSHGKCSVGDSCLSDKDCTAGLNCSFCISEDHRCVREKLTGAFTVTQSLPFNKYAYLVTHRSYAIDRFRPFSESQEDNITEQLNNGVRGLMLDVYDFKESVWLCHSFGGICNDYTAYGAAIDTLREVEQFLAANPSEIVTLMLQDYVKARNGLSKLFNESGLSKYWFPMNEMPQRSKRWPLVKTMIKKNHRLLVFTSEESKEESEGIAYKGNYIAENQPDGDEGTNVGKCSVRKNKSPLNDASKSLVWINYFDSVTTMEKICSDNSKIYDVLQTCYSAAGNRWPNFLAVDYYKRTNGRGPFQAVDYLNGKLLCGSDDVAQCRGRTT